MRGVRPYLLDGSEYFVEVFGCDDAGNAVLPDLFASDDLLAAGGYEIAFSRVMTDALVKPSPACRQVKFA